MGSQSAAHRRSIKLRNPLCSHGKSYSVWVWFRPIKGCTYFWNVLIERFPNLVIFIVKPRLSAKPKIVHEIFCFQRIGEDIHVHLQWLKIFSNYFTASAVSRVFMYAFIASAKISEIADQSHKFLIVCGLLQG